MVGGRVSLAAVEASEENEDDRLNREPLSLPTSDGAREGVGVMSAESSDRSSSSGFAVGCDEDPYNVKKKWLRKQPFATPHLVRLVVV